MAKITSTDSLNLNDLPAELLAHLITVGDKTTLIVNPEHTVDDGEVSITPIIFNSAGTIVLAILETQASNVSTLFRRGAAPGAYLSEQLQWDVTGAPLIGLHVTAIGGATNGVLLRAGVV